MSMFPTYNFANDFMGGMTATANIVNGMRESQERSEDRQYQRRREAEQDERTRKEFQWRDTEWADQQELKRLQGEKARTLAGDITPEMAAKVGMAPASSPALQQVEIEPQTGPTAASLALQKLKNNEQLNADDEKSLLSATKPISFLQTPESRDYQRQKLDLLQYGATKAATGDPAGLAIVKSAFDTATIDPGFGTNAFGGAVDASGNHVGSEAIASKHVADFRMGPDGKVYVVKQVTLKDGHSYLAPMTRNGDSSPDAPVVGFTPDDLVDKVETQRKLLDFYDAKMAGMGNKEALTSLENRQKAKAAAKSYREMAATADPADKPAYEQAAHLLESGVETDPVKAINQSLLPYEVKGKRLTAHNEELDSQSKEITAASAKANSTAQDIMAGWNLNIKDRKSADEAYSIITKGNDEYGLKPVEDKKVQQALKTILYSHADNREKAGLEERKVAADETKAKATMIAANASRERSERAASATKLPPMLTQTVTRMNKVADEIDKLRIAEEEQWALTNPDKQYQPSKVLSSKMQSLEQLRQGVKGYGYDPDTLQPLGKAAGEGSGSLTPMPSHGTQQPVQQQPAQRTAKTAPISQFYDKGKSSAPNTQRTTGMSPPQSEGQDELEAAFGLAQRQVSAAKDAYQDAVNRKGDVAAAKQRLDEANLYLNRIGAQYNKRFADGMQKYNPEVVNRMSNGKTVTRTLF